MKVLVTGGAGYIGSVTVEALMARGDQVIVVDNLSTGHRGALFPKATFLEVDLRDVEALTRVLSDHVDAVIHFAAASLVGESVQNPEKYMENNVGGTLSLLKAMRVAGVKQLVFSSTAAVYGEPLEVPIPETHPTNPTNPYGLTKLFMEHAMVAYGQAYGLRTVRLRYFNAAGASKRRGEDHRPESHLIPLVLQVALGQRDHISIFGTNYDTPDGTCVRDYIHVEDLAQAHLKALDYLNAGGETTACNLGNGRGYSVREVIEVCRAVTGRMIDVEESPRRPGDPSRLVASAARAREVLGWEPTKGDLRTIVEDAWRWHQSHAHGYADQEAELQRPSATPAPSVEGSLDEGITTMIRRNLEVVDVPYASITDFDLDSPEAEAARGLIPANVAVKRGVLPLVEYRTSGEKPKLWIAIADPSHVSLVNDIRRMLPEHAVEAVVIDQGDLKRALARHYEL